MTVSVQEAIPNQFRTFSLFATYFISKIPLSLASDNVSLSYPQVSREHSIHYSSPGILPFLSTRNAIDIFLLPTSKSQ